MVIYVDLIPWPYWTTAVFAAYVLMRFLFKYTLKRRHIVVANIARALDLLSRDDPPMAACPGCRKPLVLTFSRPGYEFHCVSCHSWFGWLDPIPLPSTAELDAQQREFQAQYREEPCH